MTNEQAANELKNYHREDGTVPEEITLAIQALETGEVYMTGEDYNLYIEGYKDGKRDFEPKQGEWIVTAEDNDGVHRICCPFCSYEKGSNNTDPIIITFNDFPKFCENCGANMRGEEV